MAKFVKGKVANPKGRPKIAPELHLVQKVTKQTMELMLSKYATLSLEELELIYWHPESTLKESPRRRNPKTPGLDLAVIGILLNATNGDHGRVDFFFNRLIGKVSDKVELDMPEPMIIKGVDGVVLATLKTKDKK